MLVRECYTEIMRDANGEILLGRDYVPIEISGERWVEMPDVLTEAEAAAQEAEAAKEAMRQAIRDQLAANDAGRGVRAISEALAGDSTRLDALRADQEALRAQLAAI